MAKQHDSGEGVFITIGLLVIILCIAGSVASHQDVMNVFLFLLFIVLNLAVLAAICIGLVSVFIYVFKRDKNDERSFLQIFKQEYSNNHLVDTYKLFLRHLGEYLGETETYRKLVKYIANIKGDIKILLKPFRGKNAASPETQTGAEPDTAGFIDARESKTDTSDHETDDKT